MMTKEERKRCKEKWEARSFLARKITKALKAGDFLKVPGRMRGWGLSGYLLILIANTIDKEIETLTEEEK